MNFHAKIIFIIPNVRKKQNLSPTVYASGGFLCKTAKNQPKKYFMNFFQQPQQIVLSRWNEHNSLMLST
jgi:hypothetical protein